MVDLKVVEMAVVKAVQLGEIGVEHLVEYLVVYLVVHLAVLLVAS